MAINIEKDQYLGLTDSALTEFALQEHILGYASALRDLELLFAAAKKAGFELAVASGWRSFDRQLKIFDEKFRGIRTVLDAEEKPLDLSTLPDNQQKIQAITRFSALPGFSRHHFGTDFDIYAPNLLPEGQSLELTAREYQQGNYFYPLGLWLEDNLSKYGFSRPYSGKGFIAYEPWHISHLQSAQLFLNAFKLDEAVSYLQSLTYNWSEDAALYGRQHGLQLLAKL
ncbi:MAG: M15 family metallopeptidase [Succinivibrio sp.]|nr:M15 family metallopeptidase [Succinivibrio sp.]